MALTLGTIRESMSISVNIFDYLSCLLLELLPYFTSSPHASLPLFSHTPPPDFYQTVSLTLIPICLFAGTSALRPSQN